MGYLTLDPHLDPHSSFSDQKKVFHTVVAVDLMLMFDRNAKIKELYPVLKSSVAQFISFYEKRVLDRFKANKDLHLEVYHFYPRQCGHFITMLYPKSDSDKDLSKYFTHFIAFVDYTRLMTWSIMPVVNLTTTSEAKILTTYLPLFG